MSARRELRWDGFYNTRDLGGLPRKSGGVTRHGAFVRSASLRFATEEGWRAAQDAGIRTIVDLRNDDEIDRHAETGPAGLAHVVVALDDHEDKEFWGFVEREQINGSPLYYRPFLDRKPERCAAIITALAKADDGGVLFHCAAGRDRTGLVSLLLLALADVEPEAIAEDYALSTAALPPLFTLMNLEDQGPLVEALLQDRGTSLRAAVLQTLDGFDVERYLLDAGVAAADIDAVRQRLSSLG